MNLDRYLDLTMEFDNGLGEDYPRYAVSISRPTLENLMSNQPRCFGKLCFLPLWIAAFITQSALAQIDSMPSSISTRLSVTTAPAEWSWEQEVARQNAKIDELLPKWRSELDLAKKREIESRLFEAFVYAEERTAAIEDVQAGGDATGKRIALPRQARPITLEPLLTFNQLNLAEHKNDDAPVARRLDKDHFELWVAEHGWLFSADGNLLNEAIPPRKDATIHWWGRGWFGAFLPDGRWVTTEIEEYDRTLTCYGRTGKWLWERKGEALIPVDKKLWGSDASLISWARADAEGKGWIVHVSHGGEAWVGANGKSRVLKDCEAWELSYPRQLGVRQRAVPDDQLEMRLVCEQAVHGKWVPFPFFSSEPVGQPKPNTSFHNGPGKVIHTAVHTDFGFWPGSSNVYINDKSEQSWFYDQQWNCLGFVKGQRIADAADGQGMLFQAGNFIVTLDHELQPLEAREFVDKEGRPVTIVALYDDVKRGMFIIGGQEVFAKWE